jgi:DNA helicase HerA-like ATPase
MVENEDGKMEPAPDSVAFWARQAGIHQGSAEALRSKLGRLANRSYLTGNPASNGLKDIIDNLQNGRHVVLSFGKNDNELDYLLVTNLITRKIRDAWEQATNEFHSGRGNEPRPLVVVVEEAHKLLNREMASQTIFSTIARELRKYYVTLLIIDQRPSQIYDEVMSQLGTRISGSLGDEDDINAVLSGLPGRGGLRGMLAKLQPKEEVLMLGWGVPMPIPIRSRRYDQQFWLDMFGGESKPMTMKRGNSLLGMDNDDSD